MRSSWTARRSNSWRRKNPTSYNFSSISAFEFYGLGVRIYQLTYNRRNLVGDGCLEPADAGLSKFGHALLERLNARRGLIDLAHSGRRTALDAIAAPRQPVTVSPVARQRSS